MGEDECLIGILVSSLDAINQSSKYDLCVVSVSINIDQDFLGVFRYTVLPLPVARDIPRRLWPFSRYDRTDWMHSS